MSFIGSVGFPAVHSGLAIRKYKSTPLNSTSDNSLVMFNSMLEFRHTLDTLHRPPVLKLPLSRNYLIRK